MLRLLVKGVSNLEMATFSTAPRSNSCNRKRVSELGDNGRKVGKDKDLETETEREMVAYIYRRSQQARSTGQQKARTKTRESSEGALSPCNLVFDHLYTLCVYKSIPPYFPISNPKIVNVKACNIFAIQHLEFLPLFHHVS